jgi:uncharacterized membrane protein YccC
MFKRARKFVQRHAPKFQVLIVTIGTAITVATIAALWSAGELALAVGLSAWALSCATIGLLVSGQAEGLVAVNG